MNVVREINKINERELDLGLAGASWHDEYKDSAYIFIGGLHYDLTEGDVVTIFSQYGEVMDVNLPRDKNTGKTKGFGFLMYEDQRSTVLAVDNLNGASILDRALRVDHVKNYKQPKTKDEDGELHEPEEQSLNARPEVIQDDGAESDSASSAPSIDPEDPMRDYLIQQRREAKALQKAKKPKDTKSKSKHKDETPEERRARKERKKAKKAKKTEAGGKGKSEGMRAVEELLAELEGRGGRERSRSSLSPDRERRTPPPRSRSYRDRSSRSRSRSPTPVRRRRSPSPLDEREQHPGMDRSRDYAKRPRRRFDD